MSNSTTKEDGLVHFWFGYFMDGMSFVSCPELAAEVREKGSVKPN